MKKQIRILVLLLAVILAASLLSACKKDNGDSSDTSANTEQTTGDPNTLTLLDGIPSDLKLGGEVKILCWNSETKEFNVQQEDADAGIISAAVFARDNKVCSRLDIDLNYKEVLGDVGHFATDFNPTVTNSYNGGVYYDIIAGYPRACGILARDGYLLNLNAVDSYMDFDKPYWPSELVNELTIGNSLYFVSGDITPSMMKMLYCVYYNATTFTANGWKDPYDCVKDNTWTLDTLYTYMSDVNTDASGGETFGMVARYFDVPALVHGTGIRLVDTDDADMIKLSDTCFSEKAITIVDELRAHAARDYFYVGYGAENYRTSYYSGNALFIITEVGEGLSLSVDNGVNFTFNCVPMPKYDSSQTRYYSTLRQPVSYFAIMSGNTHDRAKQVTAVLECMASEGYTHVRPVVVDMAMKSRFSSGPKMEEMIQLIIDSATFDFGRIYSSGDNSYLCDQMGYTIAGGENGTDSTWSNKKGTMESALIYSFQQMAQTFMELEMKFSW